MASGSNTFGGTIKLQGEQSYRKAISGINNDLKLLASEMKIVTAQCNNNDNTVDGLTNANKKLNEQIDNQVQQIMGLNDALRLAKEKYGENSTEAVKWQSKLNEAKAGLENLNGKLSKNEAALNDAKNATNDLGDATEDAGDSALSFGDILKANIISDVVVGGVKALASAFVSIGRSILGTVEETKEYRQELSILTQNTKDAGLNIDNMKDKLSNLTAITGESDSSIEALSNLMATGFDEKGLAQAVEALSGAIIKFPDTLKIESLADGLQETLATGEATGQFAELIERLGGNLETFNEKLAGCSTEAEKQQVALKWLADSGLKEVNKEYQNTNAAMIGAEEAQFRLNDAIAAFATNIEPMVAILKEGFADVLTNLVGVINGDEEAIGNLSESMGSLAENIISMVEEAFPVVMEVLATLIPTMASSIIQYLPQFVETGRTLLLKQNTKYMLSYDYKSDSTNIMFNTDLFPDTLPEIYPTAKTEWQTMNWVFSSSNASMTSATIRYFNDRTVPNSDNIYIVNKHLYECADCTTTSSKSIEYNGKYGTVF